MPDSILQALVERGLLEAYNSRPAYQRNDYLGWIQRARKPATQARRLEQMLQELDEGDKYMKMEYHPGHPQKRSHHAE